MPLVITLCFADSTSCYYALRCNNTYAAARAKELPMAEKNLFDIKKNQKKDVDTTKITNLTSPNVKAIDHQ